MKRIESNKEKERKRKLEERIVFNYCIHSSVEGISYLNPTPIKNEYKCTVCEKTIKKLEIKEVKEIINKHVPPILNLIENFKFDISMREENDKIRHDAVEQLIITTNVLDQLEDIYKRWGDKNENQNKFGLDAGSLST